MGLSQRYLCDLDPEGLALTCRLGGSTTSPGEPAQGVQQKGSVVVGTTALPSLLYGRCKVLSLWTKKTAVSNAWGNTWVELLNIHLDCHPHPKGTNVFN